MTKTATLTVSHDLLRACARAIAGRDDDRAQQDNGVGYSQADSGFGHALADAPDEAWTAQVQAQAHAMLYRYRRQLAEFGLSLPAPEGKIPRRNTLRYVETDGAVLLIHFPYNPDLLERLKAEVPGRRWDADRGVWTAPAASREPVLKFAEANDFAVTAAARQLTGPPREATNRVWHEGPRLLIQFDYSRELVADVRRIMGRRWDADRRVWIAPATSIRAVLEFADTHGLDASALSLVPDSDPVIEPTIRTDGARLLISFPFDRDLHEQLQDIPTARWNGGEWAVDLRAAMDVALLIRDRNPDLDDRAADILRQAADELAAVEASRAEDADLAIPTLNGDLLPFQRAGVRYTLRALGYHEQDGRWVKSPSTAQPIITVPNQEGEGDPCTLTRD